MRGNVTQETLDLLKGALETNNPALLAKAGWVQSSTATSGITAYDLEAPAKMLFPVLTPLRNAIPRVGGGKGIQANWRAVTGLNTLIVPATVAEGKRGGTVTTATADYLAAFRGIGLDDNVTFEAEYSADGFQDLRALATSNLLKAVMIEEEPLLLAGQGTWALGTTATPTGVLQTGVGAMTAQATVCFCIALTYDGYRRASVAGGVIDTVAVTGAGPYAGTTTVNGGHAIVSGQSGAVTTASSNLGVKWSVAAKQGAYAYAWYTGLSGAANCSLTAITTVNSFTQLADALGTQKANFSGSGSDRSQNSLAFDGITSIATKSGSNAYYVSVDGAALTFDNAGGCVQVDTALSDRWDNYKLSFTDMWISGSDALKFSKGVMTGGAGPVWRINTENGNTNIDAGGMIATRYLNKITGQFIAIHVHPNLPAGKIVLTASELPYPLNGIPQVMRVLTRQEYYSIEWPRNQRAYEYGVYADEVLQHYFPPSIGIIDNAVLA